MLETIFNSFLLVAASEMGDKTQLLAFVLATRFRQPWAVMAGIFVATIFNHLLAATVGQWVAHVLPENYLRWILAATFILFAAWILIPDKDDENADKMKWGAFLTTLILFFLAEMGDKTQLATVALAARYNDVINVTFGTTCGMLFSDGLAVIFGDRIQSKLPMKWIRYGAAFLFFIFGLILLFK